MTQVDFYVLEENSRDNQYALACRLAEQAWQKGHRVLVWTGSEDDARHMDRLLWTFRELSFIPHGLVGQASPELNPILIGHGEDSGRENDLLINLCRAVPVCFSRFQRVLECVDKDPALKSASRERWKFYREHGYPLSHQTI